MGTTSGRETVIKVGNVVEGRYRILKTLGQGGMGTVFLAEHALIKRRVAMKVLHPELATDANVIERFMNEARAAGTLGHPNIVESTDMGFTHDHVPYIVFEFLEGTLLTDEIYRVGGLPVRRVVRVAVQIASALHAAHNAKIVHRDLKSDNVFLTDKDDALDHVKVLDFGISRFLQLEDRQRSMVMGTPEFMAPEQITSPESVDKRADIYALGVILYEMLTARRPFSSDDDPRQLMHRIVHEAPPPLMRPEVPHGLTEMILNKLLAKDPADRYQTMNDVEAALEVFVTRGDGTPVPSRRRSQPMEVVVDIARDSATIPRAAKMLDTPWPGSVDTIDRTPTAVNTVTLPPPKAPKRPYALYGMAGAGILVGAIGLVIGLRGGDKTETAMQPRPVPAPAPMPATATQIPKETAKIQIQLDADAPNAHVVFRRRVTAAPATLQLTSTDVVELVEVSAPGFKTERFWLTFDRPTHLKAHLVKGNGLAEATEEETLIALGEVAPPTTPQVAAAPATQVAAAPVAHAAVAVASEPQAPAAAMAAARTVEPAAQPLAPRKIGRAAAETREPKAIAQIELPPATPPIPEPPKAEPPKVEPAQTEPPKAEPAKAEPAPLPEPVKVAVAEPAPAARPAIDNATVSSVVGTHRPEVLKCFADGKKKDHSMKGTLSLSLQVDSTGAVKRAQVSSTLNNPLVAACVMKAANGWRFPTRSGATEVAAVTYPFTIN